MGVSVVIVYSFRVFCFIVGDEGEGLCVYVDYFLNRKAVNFEKILDP